MGIFNLFKKAKVEMFAVWQKDQNAPVFDTERRFRIYTNKKLFEKSYKKNKSVFWNLPHKAIELKPINNIQIYYDTIWFHYGCKAVVIDDNTPESLEDKITTDLISHYDKNVPGHEVSNPEFKMCSILFNMLLLNQKDLESNSSFVDQSLSSLVDEYLSHLRSAELLLPCTDISKGGKIIHSTYINGKKMLMAFSSFDAIPSNLQNDGYTNGCTVNLDEMIETALDKNLEIAIDVDSPGGGIILSYDDMFAIKGVMKFFREAEQYREAGDLDKAAPLYEKAAEAGYSPAQNNLAVTFQHGTENIPADINKAIYWYDKAADTLAPAAFVLGRIYDIGDDLVPQDLQKAANYYLKAAKLGDALAMHNLGSMYYKGDGVEKNIPLAKQYFTAAAKLGEPHAIETLKILKF